MQMRKTLYYFLAAALLQTAVLQARGGEAFGQGMSPEPVRSGESPSIAAGGSGSSAYAGTGAAQNQAVSEREDPETAQAAGRNELEAALKRADALREEYRFGEAEAACDRALAGVSADSAETLAALTASLEECRTLARNGKIMLGYCSTPKVVAKAKFPLQEFYLYYPLEDRSWIQNPSAFNPSSGYPYATYAPAGAERVFFSAKDADGSLKVYGTEKADTAWTAPELLGEKITSRADDAWPFAQEGGSVLYFASEGLFGVGGYDLYSVAWDGKAQEWGEPENLGFPYSSPYNDYLFVNSPDGKYSVFASDRECPGTDSVYVYVLEFDAVPVRSSFAEGSPVEKLCALEVSGRDGRPEGLSAEAASDSGDMPEDVLRYIAQLRKVQDLKNGGAELRISMDRARAEMASLDADERAAAAGRIKDGEEELMSMEDSLRAASARLGELEMVLIESGHTVDPSALLKVPRAEEHRSAFSFVRHSFGEDPDIVFMKPKQSFDYSFKILPEGRFAEDNTLPDGLFYQVQIFSRTTTLAREKDLKGLSPVFSRKDAGGKTTYYAGLFRSYSDALSNLSKIKRAGFSTAFIVAVNNGTKIEVSKARQMEKTLAQSYQIRIIPAGGKLSDFDKAAIGAATDRDIVREVRDGEVSYLIGPFSDGAKASTVLSALKAAGVTGVAMESVTK